jgi:hypothetical protein
LKTLAVACAPALAAGRAEAHPRGAPQFRIKERLATRLVPVIEAKEVTGWELVEGGRYDLDIRLPVSELDVASFDEGTSIVIEANDMLLEFALGDDPEYFAGRRHVKLSEGDVDEHGLPFVTFRLLARWNSKEMRIQVAALTPDWRDPIVAQGHLGAINSVFEDFVSATVDVGDASFDFDVDVTGRTATRSVIRAKLEYEVSQTQLSGSGYAYGWEK